MSCLDIELVNYNYELIAMVQSWPTRILHGTNQMVLGSHVPLSGK
uniref:Uncharacterized protein n=1 Tax=Arundo donax TaxID=35708 RepID=A0A0A9B6M1_ARUDO